MAFALILVVLTVMAAVAIAGLFPRYEYAVLSPPDAELATALNEASAKGWRVVSARRATLGGTRDQPPVGAEYEIIRERGLLPLREHVALDLREIAEIEERANKRNAARTEKEERSALGLR